MWDAPCQSNSNNGRSTRPTLCRQRITHPVAQNSPACPGAVLQWSDIGVSITPGIFVCERHGLLLENPSLSGSFGLCILPHRSCPRTYSLHDEVEQLNHSIEVGITRSLTAYVLYQNNKLSVEVHSLYTNLKGRNDKQRPGVYPNIPTRKQGIGRGGCTQPYA